MLKTPDVTPAQFVGIVSAIVSTALAFGVTLTATQQHVLIADAGVVGALLFGDAVIRHGRATGSTAKAEVAAPSDADLEAAAARVLASMAAGKATPRKVGA